MSKDVARYIYDLVKNDQSDEQKHFKDIYKRRYDINDDELISKIKCKVKKRMVDGYNCLYLNNYFLIDERDMIKMDNEYDMVSENAKYLYKIKKGCKSGQTVYIVNEKARNVINEIAIPLDFKISIECIGMDYYYMTLSWDHWENK